MEKIIINKNWWGSEELKFIIINSTMIDVYTDGQSYSRITVKNTADQAQIEKSIEKWIENYNS